MKTAQTRQVRYIHLREREFCSSVVHLWYRSLSLSLPFCSLSIFSVKLFIQSSPRSLTSFYSLSLQPTIKSPHSLPLASYPSRSICQARSPSHNIGLHKRVLLNLTSSTSFSHPSIFFFTFSLLLLTINLL